MGNSTKAKAGRAAKALAAATLVSTDDLIGRVDHWVEIRCQRSLSIVGYTPASALAADFAQWHEAVYPNDKTPTDKEFVEALKGRMRIRFEDLPTKSGFNHPRIALCVNLTLLDPIAEAA